jgi:hypothetical protein
MYLAMPPKAWHQGQRECAVTAHRVIAGSATRRPLSAFLDTIRDAVGEVPEIVEPEAGYPMIARLSGHLAAMRRSVYPSAAGQHDRERRLRAECLNRARAVEWTLRLLEGRLGGDVAAAKVSVPAVSEVLARHLDGYWPAERALVASVEDRSAVEAMEELARRYQRALTRGPTRPHPRCPRSGARGLIALWLHGRWDRVLDTMDSRAGLGRDFLTLLAQSSFGRAEPTSFGWAEPTGEENSRACPEGRG